MSKKYKPQLSESDISARRSALKLQYQNNTQVKKEKFEKEKEYISDKLIEMVDMTLSSIDKETAPQQLADMLKTGDKEWKKFCAIQRVRKISVPIDMYMSTMVANLVQKQILTVPEEQKEGEQNFELNKENEKSEIDNIPQDMVENIEVKGGE